MRHSDKKHSIRLLTALLSALPLTAGAAGLGKLTVQSAIGQTLRAEVELSASKDELASMSARLASPSAFKQAGVEFGASLTGVNVSVEQRGSTPVLLITTDRVVNEPYLDMLIELSWASGRLVREYTFLLDPVGMSRPAPVEPVAVPAAPARPPARAQQSSQPAAPADGNYRVRRGDTLHRIATENAQAGVSLDQMLVALVRSNPDAFDGGNMNRLRAGRILAIPSQAEAEAVSPQEARRIVAAQTRDFAAYRSRLAGSVTQDGAAADSGSRTSGGKIEARVEDSAPAAAPSSDQVRVSKSSADADRKVSALEEEVIAKDRALKEANSRLADLERNVRELQRLVELKSTPMAEAQQKAVPSVATEPAAAPVAPAPVAAESRPADRPVPDLVAGADEKPEDKPVPDLVALADEKPAEAPATEAAAAVESAAPAVVPEPAVQAPEEPVAAEEPGLLTDPKTLAGLAGILVLLLGFLGYRKYGKSKESSVIDSPPSTTSGMEPASASTSVIGATGGGQSVDTSASSIQTDFSQSSLSSIDADEGVDPVAEADVYMAYGRDAQAEEILIEALKNEPNRHAIHLKLLEIYGQRKDVKRFENLASELYAQTGGKGADWEKAALLGRSLDPSNPLYGGGDVADEADEDEQSSLAATVVVSGADKMRDTWTLPGDIEQLTSESEPTVAIDLSKVERAESAAPAADIVAAPVASDDAGLDFDLDVQSPASGAPTVGVATTMTRPGEESDGDSALDFDLGLDFTSEQAEQKDVSTVVLEKNVAEAAEAMAQGSEGFDLDLSSPSEEADSGAVIDLERTDVGNLIDFNFDATDAPEEQTSEPVIDLSDISLDLGTDPSVLETDVVGEVPEPAEEIVPPLPDINESSVSTVINPEDMLGGEEPPQTAAEEAETKLELARAYEEMGDKEGARELLQEVVREGTEAQQEQANDMLARLA
ncbi:MAG: pilus assembly protein [Gammaproteobacteria bacterium]|nr:pilus assembly protein [Gammaproteobacteria bacterium]MBU0772100.1 pilus assembly protein [Gammaproteobacteria bacterium]MBU1848763.1 pilus assembly protein [Gammaproteobacteria bacterium]